MQTIGWIEVHNAKGDNETISKKYDLTFRMVGATFYICFSDIVLCCARTSGNRIKLPNFVTTHTHTQCMRNDLPHDRQNDTTPKPI